VAFVSSYLKLKKVKYCYAFIDVAIDLEERGEEDEHLHGGYLYVWARMK